MANVKITELTAATALAGTDVLPIVDVGADATKKVSVSDLLRNLPDGTASAPALAFADDQNTGVLSPGNNSLAFATSGTQRLVIDSSGQIGIGTSSPSNLLHVNGQARFEDFLRGHSTQNKLYIADDIALSATKKLYLDGGSNTYIHEASADNIAVATSGSERLRIDSSGRLLIGTTTGDGQLEVRNSNGIISRAPFTQATDTNKGLRVRNNSDTDTFSVSYKGQGYFAGNVGIGELSPGDKLTVGTTSDSSTAVRIQTTTTGNGEVRFGDSGSATAGYIRYAHNGNHLIFARDNTEAMRISSGGNVGIGTTSPSQPLTVNGIARFENFIEFAGSISTPATAASIYRPVDNNLAFGTASAERMRIGNDGKVYFGDFSSVGAAGYINKATSGSFELDIVASRSTSTNRDIRFFSRSNQESMRIDTSGRVLVNTSSARTNYNNTNAYGPILNLEGTSNSNRVLSFIHNDSSGGPFITLGSTGGSSAGSNNLVAAQSTLGFLSFQGADGTDLVEAAQIKAQVDGTPGANDMPGRLVFSTCADGASSPTERLRISKGGKFTASTIYSLTTTGGGPVYVESDGDLLRYTSSLKYKTDVETIEDARADAILNCRPVWYRSKCDNDIKTEGSEKSDWGWYGFIAEEVAEIEPRLVNWATKDGVKQEDGSVESVERDPADYEAEGVRYDNFVPLLVNLVKRQQAAIETLEAKVAALEAQ